MLMQDQVAFVTGAGSPKGIGRAIALGFAHEGAAVAVVGRSGVDLVAEEIESAGGSAIALAADVSDRAAVELAVSTATERLGPIDCLVNNAGFCEFRSFLDISNELWQRTLEVNVTGYFNCGQAVARRMVDRMSGGSIINITSVSAEVSGETKAHYSVTKAADKMLTMGMAVELGRYGIRVNAIAPGTIDTNIVRDQAVEERVSIIDWQATLPLGRIGTADDIVGAALFLASREASYITGATIVVDGGSLAGSLL
ncbi:MAG: SDR family NAD(P)-dependent oxidoreductase [Thermomicrobiales bacterium]